MLSDFSCAFCELITPPSDVDVWLRTCLQFVNLQKRRRLSFCVELVGREFVKFGNDWISQYSLIVAVV